jgi:16S rRNA (adenine1518-N6/adenine1519-N6)-dimethyltransferase
MASLFPPLDLAGRLHRAGLRLKKGLGQNFLVDEGALARIAQAAGATSADIVLEIGAGIGNLTRHLAASGAQVVAVEIDERLLTLLEETVGSWANVRVVPGDILGLRLDRLIEDPGAGRYIAVGNLPYYITSAVIEKLLESDPRPALIVLTVQWEVAERICARPGRMSLLAVSVQYFGQPEILERLPAGSFVPAPEVDSAIVRISVDPDIPPPAARRAFFRVAKAGFSQRRKQLVNSLAGGMALSREAVKAALAAAGIDATRRAETLSLDEWRVLSRELKPGGLQGSGDAK